MVSTIMKAHKKAMQHGWNLVKFYGAGYDPTQGALAAQGQEFFESGPGRDQARDLEQWSRLMDRGLEHTADNVSDRMSTRQRNFEDEFGTTRTARMIPHGKESSYRRGDERREEKEGVPMRSKPKEHESSFDTAGVSTGSIFDQQRPGWQGE